jgi:putative ABC transport system permease protein
VEHPAAILGLALVMTAVAARAAVKMPKRSYVGGYLAAFATLIATGLLTSFTVTRAIISVEPWYRPQYLIPLLGMVFGNSLTGISLCLDQLLESLSRNRQAVEAELAMGATRWEAVREPLAGAVRRGMIPIINSMMVVGIVSLPGMMTGQILEGADPVQAVRYQIVVMFMLAAATSLASISIALLTYRRLFNDRHQLCSDRILQRG